MPFFVKGSPPGLALRAKRELQRVKGVELMCGGFGYVCTMPCPSSEARIVLAEEVELNEEGFGFV